MSGFVYIWFDRKKKQYYVGSHWGTLVDGYVCSSPRMKRAHKKRPEDFKRRILSWVYTSRDDLFDKEQDWLSLIKPHELSKGKKHIPRYYNVTNVVHKNSWFLKDDSRYVVSEKIRNSMTGVKQTEETKAKHRERHAKIKAEGGYKPRSEESKRRMSEAQKKRFQDPEQRRLNGECKRGRSLSAEHKAKVGLASKRMWQNQEIKNTIISKTAEKLKYKKENGIKIITKPISEETRELLRLSTLSTWQDSEIREKRTVGIRKARSKDMRV